MGIYAICCYQLLINAIKKALIENVLEIMKIFCCSNYDHNGTMVTGALEKHEFGLILGPKCLSFHQYIMALGRRTQPKVIISSIKLTYTL